MVMGILRYVVFAIFAVCLALPVQAQTPSPEALAAAKQVLASSHIAQQFEVVMPSIMKALKPSIAQGRANVEREIDAITPALLAAFKSRLDGLIDSLAVIYATNFTVDELQALNAFYKSPAGQKFVEKQPLIFQQSMAAGQQMGQAAAADIRVRMIEELRKKGLDI